MDTNWVRKAKDIDKEIILKLVVRKWCDDVG
jgi:hypothetical protein